MPSRCGSGWTKLRRAGRRILFEGAQAVMLDVDHGTYPFVTCCNTVAATAAVRAPGVGPAAVGFVLGHRQGLHAPASAPARSRPSWRTTIGELLGERGHEFGTVTGRPRRCGWFDAVLVRQAVKVGGIHGLALTKLDVLDGLPELKICTGYRLRRPDLAASARVARGPGGGASRSTRRSRAGPDPTAGRAAGPTCRRRRSNTSAASRSWWKRR